jgi:hypothetical protein
MSRQLTLDLPDEVFEPLAEAARREGQSLEQWAAAHLRSCATSSAKKTGDLASLLIHAGAVDLGSATGADNETIDTDLTREYGCSHEQAK